jgi:predicted MFS family arabinose efflux permease
MLLAVSVALGAAFGLIEVAVPAAATRWHATAYSGLLLAAFAMGSIIGGLWFGHRCWRQSPEQRYLIALLLLATALVPLLAATDAATLAPLLIIAGLPYGPATISLFEALDLLPPARRTEAFTWFTTAEAIGVAIGASASGWASTNLGTEIPFALASLTLALATAAGLLLRRARL